MQFIQKISHIVEKGDNMLKHMKYKRLIDAHGFTSEIISQITADHRKECDKMKRNYNRYVVDKEDGPEIFSRETMSMSEFDAVHGISRIDSKVDHKVNNAFDVDIIDTKVAYFLGNPITYDIDKEMKVEEVKNGLFAKLVNSLRKNADENQREQMAQLLDVYKLRNNIDDQNAEWGKMAAICGYGARLLYIDKDGRERVKTYDDPWNVIFVGDITEPYYSIYSYEGADNVTHYECYDAYHVYYFKADGSGIVPEQIVYALAEETITAPQQPHLFRYNPLFGLPNNEELMGDAERVYILMYAYDRLVSDTINEVEKMRLAYLIVRAAGGMEKEDIQKMNKSGMIELFGEDDKVEYLTKNVNDNMIENALKRLERNIYLIAKTPNLADLDFGTNVSGVALRMKLTGLEGKAMMNERKMTASLRYEKKVLFSAWQTRYNFNDEDYLRVFFTFKRNIPVHLLEEAQATAMLKGNVSERTRLAALSVVDDIDYEIDEMAKEIQAYSEQYGSLDGDGYAETNS